MEVYLEIGQKRVFAGVIAWPGWCRAGRNKASALQSLLDYAPRYARILQAAQIEFRPPTDVARFMVVEQLEGNATTDFGAPDIVSSSDLKPFDEATFERFQSLLKAYWQAFDAAVQAASGKELRKGPRGGGRELEGIIEHVVGAERSYLGRLAWKLKKGEPESLSEELDRTRQAVLEALAAAVRGELPDRGPRGGVLWPPRYFVRRLAWHDLDHLWEIEDRVIVD